MSKKENGVVGLKIYNNGRDADKTLFPDSWTDDDVVSLGEYITKNSNTLTVQNDKFIFDYLDSKGKTFTIEGYFEAGTKNITTFYTK